MPHTVKSSRQRVTTALRHVDLNPVPFRCYTITASASEGAPFLDRRNEWVLGLKAKWRREKLRWLQRGSLRANLGG